MITNPRSRFHFSAAASAAALMLAALSSPGCSDDDTSSSSVAPAGPASLTILDPKDGACVVLHDDAGWTVRVSIATSNWTMRPAGYCGTAKQCGYVVAFVDDQRVAQAAALVVDVPFGGLAAPPGQHRIRVELHDDSDQPVRGADGTPLALEVSVDAIEPGGSCGGPIDDAGPDGPIDDAGPDGPIDDAGPDGLIDAAEDAAADGPDDGAIDVAEDVAVEGGDDAPEEAGEAGDAEPLLDAPAEVGDASIDGAGDALEDGETGEAGSQDGSSAD